MIIKGENLLNRIFTFALYITVKKGVVNMKCTPKVRL